MIIANQFLVIVDQFVVISDQFLVISNQSLIIVDLQSVIAAHYLILIETSLTAANLSPPISVWVAPVTTASRPI